MAYNNYFPATYQPNYYGAIPYYQQNYQQNYQQLQNQMQQGQIQPNQPGQQQTNQQGSFVRVQSEQEARAYPVAPGNSITFIDENAPYFYSKSVDMSQLDRPKFEKYRLVKEEDTPAANSPERRENDLQGPVSGSGGLNPEYALKSDLDRLSEAVDALKRQFDSRKAKQTEKKGAKDDAESAD